MGLKHRIAAKKRGRFLLFQCLAYAVFFCCALVYENGFFNSEEDGSGIGADFQIDGQSHRSHLRKSGEADPPRKLSTADYWPDPLLGEPTYEDIDGKWRIIFHIMGIFYMFAALSIVVDEYFCSALTAMVDTWKIKEDVAGATFMAAGGSAPELFTSVMGVFVSKSDVGFGTIIGSAVFNVLFVIGLCAVFAKEVLALTWWPLFRDCTYYILGLCTLAAFVANEEVTWYEALILFTMYILYCTIMYYNEELEAKVEGWVNARRSGKLAPEEPQGDAADVAGGGEAKEEKSAVGTPKSAAPAPQRRSVGQRRGSVQWALASRKDITRAIRNGTYGAELRERMESKLQEMQEAQDEAARARLQAEIGELADSVRSLPGGGGGAAAAAAAAAPEERTETPVERMGGPGQEEEDEAKVGPWADAKGPGDGAGAGAAAAPASSLPPSWPSTPKSVARINQVEVAEKEESRPAPKEAAAAASEEGGAAGAASKGEEEDEEEAHNPFDIPEGAKERALWAATLPLVLALHFTIPNCAAPRWERFFLLTFGASLVWIALFSYLLVWWCSIVGEVLGWSDVVMGLTILAAGTSIPDALSSVIMARMGQGDMAVSSSIGSNVFDILVGLPIPWFIYTAMYRPGEVVTVQSPYLVVHTALLLVMVFAVISSIMLRKWRLDMTLGAIMGSLYFVFLICAVYLETAQPAWAVI